MQEILLSPCRRGAKILTMTSSHSYTLITGASGGIGQELAIIAAREGHNLVLVARNKEKLIKLARELTKRHDIYAEVIACDLSETPGPKKVCDVLGKKHLTIDTLINNAGFGDYGEFLHSDLSTQLNMIDLNIRSLTELTHRLLPGMVERGSGRIMNVGSVASFLPGPLMSVYFASKAYVLSFSEALVEELKGSGVTVTCLCPGSTSTGFGDNANVSETHSTKTTNVTAADVAEYGWDEMMRGSPVAIHRFNNRAAVWLTRFFPRAVVRRLVHWIQR